MSTVLITGCDYKIGFEFARQYAANGWTVHTICLQPDSREKIAPLGANAVFHQLDVSDEGTFNALAKKLRSTSIDLVINNATTFAHDGPGL